MNIQPRQQAIQRIRARQQFYLHLAFFLAMNVSLVAVWARSGALFFWPIWAMIGWGIGVVSHASHVYGWQWPINEERIQREIDRSV
ncbi:MAG: 2TM domain-containing protein [Acidimicrobiia bacterium]